MMEEVIEESYPVNKIQIKMENEFQIKDQDFSFRGENLIPQSDKEEHEETVTTENNKISKIDNPTPSLKRKHLNYTQEEHIKSEMGHKIKVPLDSIFQMYMNKDFFWFEEFKYFISAYIDIYLDVLPRSINEEGSFLFTLSQFWVMYTQMKIGKSLTDFEKKEDFLLILNNASEYTLDNKLLLIEFFIKTTEEIFSKEEILFNINDNPLNLDKKETFEEVIKEDYRFLLINPDFLIMTVPKRPSLSVGKIFKKNEINNFTVQGSGMFNFNSSGIKSDKSKSEKSDKQVRGRTSNYNQYSSSSSCRSSSGSSEKSLCEFQNPIKNTVVNLIPDLCLNSYIISDKPNVQLLRKEIIENTDFCIIKSEFSITGEMAKKRQYSLTKCNSFSLGPDGKKRLTKNKKKEFIESKSEEESESKRYQSLLEENSSPIERKRISKSTKPIKRKIKKTKKTIKNKK